MNFTTRQGDDVYDLDDVFSDIAGAIKEKSGVSTSMYPYEMGNRIRSIKDIDPQEVSPSATLIEVFQDIALATRECGVVGTMTPLQMSDKIMSIVVGHELTIVSEDEFVGKTLYCRSFYDGTQVAATWSLTSGSQYATINENGKIDVNSGVQQQTIGVRCSYNQLTAQKSILVSYDNQLSIECDNSLVGTSATILARYNQEIVQPQWSLVEGSSIASIASDGTLTITGTGDVTIEVQYQGYTTDKTISVEYEPNTSSEIVVNEDGSITTTTETTTHNPDGSTTVEQTSTTTNEDGYFIKTESSTTENQDGSSETTSTTTNQDGSYSETTSTTTAPDQQGKTTTNTQTTNYDENGDETGSQTYRSVDNSDGSSQRTTTNYNESGNPTDTLNEVVDTSGNVSDQSIVYDSSGDPVVTGYSIDTSDNPEGSKEFDMDGVNTQFYGFDAVTGFTLDFHFTFDFTDQPPNQDGKLNNILTMKRSNPSPWYGFQLRYHPDAGKKIQLGTQFASGDNTNLAIAPTTENWVVESQIAEFNFHITYDPTLSSNNFVCNELISNRNIMTRTGLFPDIPELRYLTVCLGCALDDQGDPYRYSKIDVVDFNVEKLPMPLVAPTMSFSENVITISCATLGAEIQYRTNTSGPFKKYTKPIEITQDTTIQAYSRLQQQTSETITQTFQYDDGIEEPVIRCDGEYVEINCETMGADIYYRIGTSGNFTLYSEPFEISQTVTVQAYATIEDKQSETMSETCVYVPVVLADPVISCEDNVVEITCETNRAEIYFRRNEVGEFALYDEPFTIEEDTLVEAYSTYKQQTSQIVSEECEWTPAHDYSKDYLTFRVRSPGTIVWKSIGSGQEKTISYSINNGEWVSVTATSGGQTISVVAGDVVRFKGNNTTYARDKSNYSGFEGGTSTYDIEGNIMSLLYGDNFQNTTELTNTTYQFCSLFKLAPVVSAKNLVLPATTLKNYCYRAMFSKCSTLVEAPALPATTLAQGCYWYMFEECSITIAPELNATTLVRECYGYMFTNCAALNTIICLAESGFNTPSCLSGWVTSVSATGTFVKSSGATSWIRDVNGIPIGWIVLDDKLVYAPTINFDGEDTIILTCDTEGASIYYRLNQTGEYQLYTQPIVITQDTLIDAYATLDDASSVTVLMECVYVEKTPYQRSNIDLPNWTYSGNTITTPFSVNNRDGHSSGYAKGSFTFDTFVQLKQAQPTYLWFQHADQTADIYVDNNLVGRHWGGYAAFFFDISEYVHAGTNNIKVVLNNTTRQTIAPCSGDFNFNATLGNVKLFTSPYLPAMKYGYDGFHITSTVTSSSATVNVKTTVPSGATLVCTITNEDGYRWSDTKTSNGEEQTFRTTITGGNLHLWGGKPDPYLYNVKLEIYKDNELYHKYERPYGLRYYSYVIDQTIDGEPYTGFLLNGQPYLLRGVCMHDDLAGKANALTDADYDQEFAIIQELGCNFLRLAHYPHPKEVYDRCDQMGIIVQTEGPCVNNMRSTFPEEYFTHLTTQYTDMVEQHFNHPCIMFWGLSNETVTDDKEFAKEKINGYIQTIKDIDSERLVGYVMSQSCSSGVYTGPAGYYNDPDADWFGCNIYVGWYDSKTSNDPTQQLNTRLTSTLYRIEKPIAFSEYGAGGTQHCHSDNFSETTTPGNYARHDIEYQMWLHEGHIATIRNFPQLLFTSAWQLFDVAVSSRNEGYIECLDGETTSENDELRRLNNKGLVERDHITKKDTFYLYKAEWNSKDKFVHICGKDYTKITDRVLKCYTNDGNSLSLYEGSSQTPIETVQVVDHIAQFTARTFTTGVEYKVSGGTTFDTVTF